jgi:hypothetical protein
LDDGDGDVVVEREKAVAAFVVRELGCEVTRLARVAAFASNVVYEVDAGGGRFVVKASTEDAALRAEAWACARGGDAGCAAPAILGVGRLGCGDGMSAFIMSRVAGSAVVSGHPALAEAGVGLRALHHVRLPGFGWLAQASWDTRGGIWLPYNSWPAFLHAICADVCCLVDVYPIAGAIGKAAEAAINVHAGALAAVEVGSLCHGDLKAAHILAAGDRLAGVIDWGDAVVGDPLWDIARFAHRADAGSVSVLLNGYAPAHSTLHELAWRMPLYQALWMMVDAVVAHRGGQVVAAVLAGAKGHLEMLPS